MYGGEGNVDESQVCLERLSAGNVPMSSMPPAKTHCPLIRPTRRQALIHWRDSHAQACTQSQTHTGFRQGENERCYFGVKGRRGIMIISMELRCQEFNVCSEALSSIIQVKRDSGVIC